MAAWWVLQKDAGVVGGHWGGGGGESVVNEGIVYKNVKKKKDYDCSVSYKYILVESIFIFCCKATLTIVMYLSICSSRSRRPIIIRRFVTLI